MAEIWGAVLGGVAVAGGSVLAAKESQPDAVAPRNIGQELRETFDAMLGIAPERFAATAEYMPQYTRLGTARDSTVRGAGVADVGALAPAVSRIRRSAAPAAYELVDSLVASGSEALARGGALSGSERRDVNQRSRAAYSARGLASGAASAGAELLDEDRFRRGRLEQDRGFAMAAAGIGVNAGGDPFGTVLGIPTTGYGDEATTGFDPMSGYAADLHNTNLNKAASEANASANNRAAMYGAGINGIADIYGNYLANRPTGAKSP